MKRVVVLFWVACLFAVGGALGCGGEDSSSVTVNLYGWQDDGSEEGVFFQGVPDYPNGQFMRVRVVRPSTRTVLKEETVPMAERRLRIPEIPSGQGLRLDFEVRSETSAIASGSTPLFSFGNNPQHRGFRAMISAVNEFAPAASMVRVEATGEQRLVRSRMDRREISADWIGRVGHTVTPTEGGKLLIVGGGLVGNDHDPGSQPDLQEGFSDIQIFDPATGYFTELAGDDAARSTGTVGSDRLQNSRAFHTVTALGGDRFLVVGGFRVSGGSVVATSTIEVVDLTADPGTRVQVLVDSGGAALRLEQPRAMHTATLRTSDGAVVVAGGFGASDNRVMSTFEVVRTHPQNASVLGNLSMRSARTAHAAVLLSDGESVWLLGGRNSDGVLASTEVIARSEAGEASTDAADMDRARMGFVAHPLGAMGQQRVAVIGGFTGLAGGATGVYAFGTPDLGFSTDSSWRLNEARGGATLVELPQSRRMLVLGGLDADRNVVGNAEILTFQGIQNAMALEGPHGSMRFPRRDFAAAMTDTGRVLLVGGKGVGEIARDDAEYFNPRDPVIPPRQ